jgi:hypothetical protein
MALNRDEVATMIIDALSLFEGYKRGITASELLDVREVGAASKVQSEGHFAQREGRLIVSVLDNLRQQLLQPRKPEFGRYVGVHVGVHTLSDPDVTRVSVWDPMIGDTGTIWNWAEFDFPPNRPRFLEELVRGQNHGRTITIGWRRAEGGLVITHVAVG